MSSGGKGGGGGGRVAQEDPNTLRSNSIARLLVLVSEGPVDGLVDGLKSVLLDGTPLQAEDGSYNFSGVEVETRNGLPDQTYIPGFPAIENYVSVNAEVKHDSPVTRTITGVLDAVRVTVRLPRLTNQDTKTGDLRGSSVRIYIDVKPDGGSWERLVDDAITGKTTSDYQRDYRVELENGGPWDVRVGRITSDSESSALQNETFFDGYTEINDIKLMYPNSALLGLRIDAEQFGDKMPTISSVWRGVEVQVPANYNPETRAYTGVWNGSFKTAWTDNPAWILYDLITQGRYGLDLEADARSSKGHFYAIAQYCDEMVDDGFGGKEPRYTFNLYLAKQQDAYAVLKNLSSAFRGMTYWGSGSVVPTQDSPGDPTQIIGPANVVDGEFKYKGNRSSQNRHSVALVTWNDPADNYKPAIEVVEDREAIASVGWRTTDVLAVGCTSRGQAHRLGRWELDAEWRAPEIVNYRCGLDQLGVRPGDVVAVLDPSIAGIRLSGRVAGFSGNRLTVDYLPDDFDLSLQWDLSVVLPDGSIGSSRVAGFDGAELTLSGLSSAPQIGAMWALQTESVVARKFRVMTVTESEGLVFDVVAVSHDPNKYLRVEQDIFLDEEDYSLIPSGAIPPPKNLGYEEYLYEDNGVIRSGLLIAVTLPLDPRIAFVEYEYRQFDDVIYFPIKKTSDVSIDLKGLAKGDYRIRARALSSKGVNSGWMEITAKVNGKTNIGDVKNFLVKELDNGTRLLSWDAVPDAGIEVGGGYKIRGRYGVGLTWSELGEFHTGVVTSSPLETNRPFTKGKYVFGIVAVDSSGQQSKNPTLYAINFTMNAPGWRRAVS